MSKLLFREKLKALCLETIEARNRLNKETTQYSYLTTRLHILINLRDDVPQKARNIREHKLFTILKKHLLGKTIKLNKKISKSKKQLKLLQNNFDTCTSNEEYYLNRYITNRKTKKVL